MFLKKKQTDSETNDVLQQIKEKISDTGNVGSGGLSNQVFEQNATSQSTSNTNANIDYSDEDDELLNMLLSDDTEDEEDEDNDDLNDLSNKNDGNVKINASSDDSNNNVVDNVNKNDDEEVIFSTNNDIGNDDDIENDEYIEELEDNNDKDNNKNGSVVDDVLNELKDSVGDNANNQGNSIDTIGDKLIDDNIDEDDIEFYNSNNDNIKSNEGNGVVFDDNEIASSNIPQEQTEVDDDIEDWGNIEDEKSVEDDGTGEMVSGADLYDDNEQQDDEKFVDVMQQGAVKPVYKKQNSKKINKGFNNISISDNTKRSVRKNISSLIEQVRRQVVDESADALNRDSGSKTLEQIAVDLIQPVVIDYLNNNLERIVSDIVNEEIKRITDDIDK